MFALLCLLFLLQISVFNSTPPLTSVTGSLVTFSAGMPASGSLNTLQNALIAGENTLNSAPYTTRGPGYKTWLTGLRCACCAGDWRFWINDRS
jgi:hypothetical protein